MPRVENLPQMVGRVNAEDPAQQLEVREISPTGIQGIEASSVVTKSRRSGAGGRGDDGVRPRLVGASLRRDALGCAAQQHAGARVRTRGGRFTPSPEPARSSRACFSPRASWPASRRHCRARPGSRVCLRTVASGCNPSLDGNHAAAVRRLLTFRLCASSRLLSLVSRVGRGVALHRFASTPRRTRRPQPHRAVTLPPHGHGDGSLRVVARRRPPTAGDDQDPPAAPGGGASRDARHVARTVALSPRACGCWMPERRRPSLGPK